MNRELLKTLISEGIIKAGVELEARYMTIEFSGNSTITKTGEFVIFEIIDHIDSFDFVCASSIDGKRRVIPERDVICIDGMIPERFAHVFGYAPDGSKLKVGKRRGRKPRHLLELEDIE